MSENYVFGPFGQIFDFRAFHAILDKSRSPYGSIGLGPDRAFQALWP